MADDEMHLQVLRLLNANPGISQRDVARELGVSLGKVNYCVRALVQKGWVKVSNFRNSRNKKAYIYLLTPRGIEHKGRLTLQFLQRKVKEYEILRAEIQQMLQETERRE